MRTLHAKSTSSSRLMVGSPEPKKHNFGTNFAVILGLMTLAVVAIQGPLTILTIWKLVTY